MRELDALSGSEKHDRVVADDVAPSEAEDPNLTCGTLSDHALTRDTNGRRRIEPGCPRGRLRKRQSSAAR